MLQLGVMVRCRVLAAAMLGVLVGPAVAQDTETPTAPPTSAAALRRVTSSCRAETLRFCPALAQAAPTPRNQAICLRPYKTSLSLGCRSAVNAVIR